ncbi:MULTISPECIES: PucR family transcriptional regulator [Arthrobacter]|uniref:PucR family transcriptional regulator ligand-binding domain-containing protein n=2 Tax=Arthrobacter TaxID=1663 RepID=A0ABU9KRI7_9MICC|nr:PucR family transcriptional regulator [Arthrobacter sp. YJM1]MDP5228513.1 PucR family transcriptional regulator ligand-binding domain-containing protein [Arthrobacter sp. YJM1]
MISLAQLQHQVGDRLRTLDGRPPAAQSVTGVHISELEDPTPYLEGGELLLTTGIPVRGTRERTRDYVSRIAARGITALGLGLGAGIDDVPEALREACAGSGVALLVVPDGVPFMDISRAYWDLVARLGQSDLVASLGTQTALARAATRPDALRSVVRALAQALGGWAAYLPQDAGEPTYWPPSAAPFLPLLRQETARLRMSSLHSAATFQVHGADVVEHPILVGQRIVGVLAIGAGRTLTRADRQVIQTVCVLLSLKAQQDSEAEERAELLHSAVLRLLLGGHAEPARLLAEELGIGLPGDRVRLALLEGVPEGTPLREASALLGSLGRDTDGRPGVAVARCADGARLVLLLREEGDDDGGQTPAVPQGWDGGAVVVHSDEGRTQNVRAALSPPVALAQLPEQLVQLRAFLPAATWGAVQSPPLSPLDPRADAWIAALRSHDRADLPGTVRVYLRHRGHWESAARELGIHRNSLRHRMAIAARLLDADPDDPDIAANLWLALRRA